MEQRELTRQERSAIRKLVTSLCANYDREYGCLLGLGPPRKLCLRGERRSSGASELAPQAEANDTELVTTSDCYMLGKCWTGAYCRYFREAVLPNDSVLETALTAEGPAPESRLCPICGRAFLPEGKQAYCSAACAGIARRKRQRNYMRDRRRGS